MNINVIRTLTLRSKAEGAQETAAALKSVQSAYDGVAKSAAHTATATDTSAKSQLSLAQSLERSERRFNATLRAQQDFEKVQREMNRVIAQNPALQERANAVIAQARQHFDQAAKGSAAYGRAMQEMQSQAAMLSGRLGPLGGLLSAMGSGGIAAAAGIGALALAFHQSASAALELADRAGKLRDLSDTVGLTVMQIQALERAGAQVGVSSEQLRTGVERLSVSFAGIRERSGEAYEALLKNDPALARQASNAKNLAEAYDLVIRNLQKANQEQRNAAARQIFSRGGVGMTRVGAMTDEAGGLQRFTDSLRQADLITTQQAKHWDDLGDTIKENLSVAHQIIVSTFAGPTLESLKAFTEAYVEFAHSLQETDWTGFKNFMSELGDLARLVVTPLTALVEILIPFREGGGAPLKVTTGGTQEIDQQADAIAKWGKEAIQAANDNKRLMDALGGTATPAEQLTARLLQLNAQLARGKIDVGGMVEAQDRLRAAFELNRMQETVSALGDAATAAEKYQLQVAQLEQKLKEGRISQEAFDRAVRAADPVVKQLTNVAEQLGAALIDAFMSGKNAAEALNKSLQDISKTAANETLKNLLKGDWASAAISGAIAVGSAIASTMFDDGSRGRAQQEQNQRIQEQRERVRTLQDESRAASLPQGSRQAAFLDLELEARQRREQVKSRQELVLQEQIIQQKLLALTIEWDQKELDQAKQHQEALAAARLSFEDRLFQATNDNSTLAGQLAEFDRDAARERLETARDFASLLPDLDRALAAERLNIERDFARQAIEDARRAAEEQARAVQALNDRLFAAGNDTSTVGGALAAFDRSANRQRFDEAQAGNINIVLLEQVLAAERLGIVQDFAQRALAAEQQAAEQRQSRMQSLADRLFAAQTDTSTQEGALAAFDRAANQERAEEAARGGADLLRLEQTLDTERFNIIRDFTQRALAEEQRAADERAQAAEQHQARMQLLADRLFAAQTDTSTLEGALAAFDRGANRERLEEAQRGGDDLLRLEQTLDTERFNIIRDFGQRAIDEERRIADERQTALNQAARSVVDYVNSLLAGPESHLSSSARLAAAQSTYDATLALAQGNNIEALSRITQDFENLRKAAQNQFGSGTGYQNILTSGIAQLLALPAVTTSTDPIVNALADVVAALTGSNGVRAAVVAGLDANSIMAQRLGLVNGSLGGTTTASAVQSVTEALAGANGTKLAVDAVTGALTGTGGTKLAVDAVRDALGTSASTGVRGAVVDVHNTLHGTGTNTVFGAVGAVRDAVGTAPTMGVLGAVGTVTTALAGTTGAVGGVTGAVNAQGGTTAAALQTMSQDLTAPSGSIKAAIQGPSGSLTEVISGTRSDSMASGLGNVGTKTDTVGVKVEDLDASGTALDVARQQLQILNQLISGSTTPITQPQSTAFGVNIPGFDVTGYDAPTSITNTMLQALNKIVWNTGATAHNIGVLIATTPGGSTQSSRTREGIFASGGILGAGNFGIFGEHHPAGPWLMRAGEQPVSITPSMPPSFAANDNGAMLSEVRRLTGVVERQTQVIGSLLSRIAQLEERNVEATERNTAHRNQTSEADRREMRLNARKKTGTG